MGDPVTEMDQRGQQPVDEHQPLLRAGAHRPLPRASGKPRLMTLMPQRPALLDEFSNHSGSQPRDPPIADDHRARRDTHHPTMINHLDSTSHRLPGTSSLGVIGDLVGREPQSFRRGEPSAASWQGEPAANRPLGAPASRAGAALRNS